MLPSNLINSFFWGGGGRISLMTKAKLLQNHNAVLVSYNKPMLPKNLENNIHATYSYKTIVLSILLSLN